MSISRIHALIAAAFALLAGILLGSQYFPREVPADPQPSTVNVFVQPGQDKSNETSEPPVVVFDAPFYAPEQTPEETLLQAIALMKPGGMFISDASPAARTLAIQLQSNGYYYHVTYQDGTERINHESGANPNSVTDDVEFVISNTGVVLSAARYGLRTTNWGVHCLASPAVSSMVDDLDFLLEKTLHAARWWNADKSCAYARY